MSEYINNPEEAMNMFSEALKIMDSNTVKYMIEELSDELSDAKNKLVVTVIEMTKEFSGTKEQAVSRIIKDCGKTEQEAIELVETYW